jgi:hypothetical protein
MNTAVHYKIDTMLDGQKRPSSVMFRWLKLCFGFFLVWVFMFVLAPAIEKLPHVKPLAQFIEDTGIDASALYYTELPETADAEMYLRDAARYAPRGGSGGE